MQTMNYRRKRNDPSNGNRTQVMKGTRATPSIARLTVSARKFLSFRMPNKGVPSPPSKQAMSPSTNHSMSTVATQPMSGAEMADDGRTESLQKSRLVLGTSAESLFSEIYLEGDGNHDYGGRVNDTRVTTLRKSQPLVGVSAESLVEGMYLDEDDDNDSNNNHHQETLSTRDVVLTPIASRPSKTLTIPDFAVSPVRARTTVVKGDQASRGAPSSSPTCDSPSEFSQERTTKSSRRTTRTTRTTSGTTIPARAPTRQQQQQQQQQQQNAALSSPTKQRRPKKTRADLQRPSLRDFLTSDGSSETLPTNNARQGLETKSLHGSVGGGSGGRRKSMMSAPRRDQAEKFRSMRDIISAYESIVGDDEKLI